MNNRLEQTLRLSKTEIIHQDDAILVLNKASGLLVLPDRYDDTIPNLLSILKKEIEEVFVVHRIDRETSGVILFAKTAEAHKILSRQFELRQVKKQYLVIVAGTPQENNFTITLPLSESAEHIMRVDHRHGKASQTRVTVIEQFQGYALVEAVPSTGRMHQIRAHLKAAGMPVLCDPLYGSGKPFFLSSIKRGYKQSGEVEKPLINRTALHAHTLTITHPAKEELSAFTADVPPDMVLSVKYLKKFRPDNSKRD